MSKSPLEKLGTARGTRRGTARGGATLALLLLLGSACPRETSAPSPSAAAAEQAPVPDQPRAAPPPGRPDRTRPPRPPAPTRTLAPEARAALHRDCASPTPGCPVGLTCVRYCGVAGCRPGGIFHSCELPCARDAPCPDGLRCATVADGPGAVCQDEGSRPPALASPGAGDE
jgi:hypothetical protein